MIKKEKKKEKEKKKKSKKHDRLMSTESG